MIHYPRIADPALITRDRYPALDAISAQCEARPEFEATRPAEYKTQKASLCRDPAVRHGWAQPTRHYRN
jgi:glutathione S-transferase